VRDPTLEVHREPAADAYAERSSLTAEEVIRHAARPALV
jgi:hypothetical protein